MPDRPATWDDLVRHEATNARVPPQLALALMQQESSGQPGATSEVGAHGLFQLMPATAKELGVDPNDPIQNIRGGVTYLRQQLDATKGDVAQALARYHGGPDLSLHGPKTAAYVQSILARLQGQASAPTPASGSPAATPQVTPVSNVGQPPPGRLPLRKPWEAIQKPLGPVATPPPQPSFLRSMAEQFDPRTSTGRRNIAGGIGAGAATAAVVGTAPVSAPVVGLAAATAGALGAFSGGQVAEAGEQLVGTKPPSSIESLKAGGEQGAYELAGQALLWPVRAVGRRVIASRVGRAAAEHLGATKQAVVDQTHTAIQAAKDLFGQTKTRLSNTLAGAVGTPPPVPSTVGRGVQEVIAGPARSARQMAGEAVEQAAESGPAVNITDLKAEAQRILEQELQPSATAFPRQPVESGDQLLAAAGISPSAMATIQARGGPNASAIQDAIAAAQGESEKDLLKHPAMGVISRILNAEDEVPFAAAHAFKRELDEAIGAPAWDRIVQKRVTNITKTLRGTLRESLAGHGPYNQATAKYASIAPLYTKEIAPKLRRLAETRPEALLGLIKGNEPTPLRMLHELLTTQATEGGGGAQGQAAWDSLRSSWTHEKILRGGIEKLETSLAKLDPEFVQVMYGDPSGQAVLANLRTISTAYQQAVAREPADIAAAKLTGKQGLAAAQAEMKRLAQSSLGRLPKQGETWADLIRAGMVPNTFWGAYSIGRLLKGPRVADLLEWAAYSPANTQRLVKAFTSPIPGMAVADLFRAAVEPSVEQVIGRPPTTPAASAPPPRGLPGAVVATVGAPPPTP